MSDSESVERKEWSVLTTVTDFDSEFSNAQTQDIVAFGDGQRNISNSLFVESLIDQLSKLLVREPSEQRRLYEMLCSKLFDMSLVGETYRLDELASLRGHYQQALVSLTTASPHTETRGLQLEPLELSRYRTEYEELSFIACGGFGRVFKARHRLDGVEYAIKIIPIRNKNLATFKKRLKEVKTLARLNHPNIVQYKGAWLEPLLVSSTDRIQPELSVISDSTGSSGANGIVFTDSRISVNDVAVHERKERGCAVSELLVTHTEDLALCQYQANVPKRPFLTQVSALLHVSMQLCDVTLRQWLDDRNTISDASPDLRLAMNIFTQVTQGLDYIHSSGIVHHDVKPSNIFLSGDHKSVQLGDFGLSCCLHGHSSTDPCPLGDGQTGTLMYAAPEQLRGECTPKSDIYSLGLVLVELVTVFNTAMERSVVLNKLKAGVPPRSLVFWLFPVVRDMTASDPALRQTAAQLLSNLKRIKARQLAISRAKIVSMEKENPKITEDPKDKEIAELKKLLLERDNEIAELKKKKRLELLNRRGNKE